MPSLNGTLPLAQMNHVPEAIPQHLNLNMARLHHQLLQIHLAVMKRAFRFARSIADSRLQIALAIHPPHPFSAPARRSLEQYRIPQRPRSFFSVL